MKKSWKVRKAEATLAKFKKREELAKEDRKKERDAWQAKRDAHNDLIDGFTNEYIDAMVLAFKHSNKPEFGENEQAVLNWYAPGNSWEGNIRSNLNHVSPELGPIYVIVSKCYVDQAFLRDYIETKMDDTGMFDILTSEKQYRKFAEMVDKARMSRDSVLGWIGYSYTFRALDDKIKLPTYSMRETNFLKIGTEEEKAVRELWGLEQESDKLRKQIEKNHTIIKEHRRKAEKISKSSAKFYVGIL